MVYEVHLPPCSFITGRLWRTNPCCVPVKLELSAWQQSRRYENYVSCVWKYVRLIFWKTTACHLCMKLI